MDGGGKAWCRWWLGRGGGGGGTGGAEWRCCGAVHRQGCDRPHAAQVPAVQGVHGQFIDRVLDISVVLREGYKQCKLCRRLCLVSTSM